MTHSEKKTTVVVLGAGYAGLVAAKRLARQSRAAVRLVNAEPDFVERIRLHQAAAGQSLAELPLADLLGDSGVDLVVGTVTEIDLAARLVRVGADRVLRYDILVYALGSVSEADAVPGLAEHAVTLSDRADAARLAERTARCRTITVCGGGPTGVEVATELAESHPGLSVRMITKGRVGGWLSARASRYLDRQLDRFGIEVIGDAEVVRVERGAVVLADGTRVGSDVTVWCGGFTVPVLAREAGLAVNERGRVVVDETLRSVSHPEVYAVGDAVAVAGPWGAELSYGCRSGGFTGPYAADTIAARLAGRAPKPFRFRYVHQCISLGRRRGLVQFVRGADESPLWMFLRGRIATWYKEIVSSSAIWLFRHPGPYLSRRRS
ncbi:NAD(P)/FAD-dependent oxidoreductase [Allokutzneria oryzae]|uniref:NAD(P)/FAD-dependent oxidoreductase n=1 Tax=Allokutzneria oryzae TaxID=1378989 RepID=A0ABV5ZT15_9PSEU